MVQMGAGARIAHVFSTMMTDVVCGHVLLAVMKLMTVMPFYKPEKALARREFDPARLKEIGCFAGCCWRRWH